MPQLFTTARNHNGKVIPVVSLHDILGSSGAAFPLVAAEGCSRKYALRVESGDIIDPQFSLHIRNALSRLGVKAEECTLLLDFCDADFTDAEIVAEIKDLLDKRVRPAVAGDGGDIVFRRFDAETGVVTLTMRGACAGCPSSTMTLKSGIENLLRHYVPEVTAVEAAA